MARNGKSFASRAIVGTGLLAFAIFPASAAPTGVGASVMGAQIAAQIQQALDDQRYLDAGAMLDRALIANGSDASLVILAGQLNLSRGRYDAALGSFKRVDTQMDVKAAALEGEGIALLLLGRTAEALPVLEAAVRENPRAWRAWNALGSVYDRDHQWTKAEAAYEEALSNSSGAALVLNNRGFSRLSQNRPDEAATDFVAALQKKPDMTPARNNLRLAIAMKGDYARAIEGASAKDRAAVLNNAGFAAMARGDYAEAESLLGQAIQAKGEYYAAAAANLELVHGLETGGVGDRRADIH